MESSSEQTGKRDSAIADAVTSQGKRLSHFKQRQLEFVQKYGYNFKAYLIAGVVFPPAAMFIAFKIARWPMPVRIVAAALPVLVHLAVVLGVFGLIIDVVT